MVKAASEDCFSRLLSLIAAGTYADARIVVALRADIPLAVVHGLIEGLPREWRLTFFDPDYPSESDPGAYVTVTRQGNRYRLRHANHGWTGFWQEQSVEDVAQYLYECRASNSSLGHYDGPVELSRYHPRER